VNVPPDPTVVLVDHWYSALVFFHVHFLRCACMANCVTMLFVASPLYYVHIVGRRVCLLHASLAHSLRSFNQT